MWSNISKILSTDKWKATQRNQESIQAARGSHTARQSKIQAKSNQLGKLFGQDSPHPLGCEFLKGNPESRSAGLLKKAGEKRGKIMSWIGREESFKWNVHHS